MLELADTEVLMLDEVIVESAGESEDVVEEVLPVDPEDETELEDPRVDKVEASELLGDDEMLLVDVTLSDTELGEAGIDDAELDDTELAGVEAAELVDATELV